MPCSLIKFSKPPTSWILRITGTIFSPFLPNKRWSKGIISGPLPIDAAIYLRSTGWPDIPIIYSKLGEKIPSGLITGPSLIMFICGGCCCIPKKSGTSWWIGFCCWGTGGSYCFFVYSTRSNGGVSLEKERPLSYCFSLGSFCFSSYLVELGIELFSFFGVFFSSSLGEETFSFYFYPFFSSLRAYFYCFFFYSG